MTKENLVADGYVELGTLSDGSILLARNTNIYGVLVIQYNVVKDGVPQLVSQYIPNEVLGRLLNMVK